MSYCRCDLRDFAVPRLLSPIDTATPLDWRGRLARARSLSRRYKKAVALAEELNEEARRVATSPSSSVEKALAASTVVTKMRRTAAEAFDDAGGLFKTRQMDVLIK